ncbi:MAG: hypothetical protein ACYC5Q_14065 [Thermoleophilia bacterium]
MEKPTPEQPRVAHRFRMVLWMAIVVVPVFIYPLLAWMIMSLLAGLQLRPRADRT